MRRLSLWLSVLPLLAGVGLYWFLWSGWARDFQAVLRGWLPESAFEISGFPYRMEGEILSPHLTRGDVVRLSASADLARINRGPWQPELTVIQAERPHFGVTIGPVLRAQVVGNTALTSVHVLDGRLARLSTIVQTAMVTLGFVPFAIAADALELHLRERTGENGAIADARPGAALMAPSGAVRGQLVLAGERLRLGGGDALTLAADLVLTGTQPLSSYDDWAANGTAEVTSLTLGDAAGEVARVRATLVPLGRSGLRFAGTVDTVCPASVAAAFAGVAAGAETRLRTPVRLAFSGGNGAVVVSGVPADLATRAVRRQVAACPVMRRPAP